MSAETYIAKLELEPHPEGGFYRETFVSKEALPTGRAAATSILFLLTHENPSNLHRIDAEEVWCYHAGDPLIVHMIDVDGVYSESAIGPDLDAGQVLQAVVPAGVWFGSSVADPKGGSKGWALVGCMVAPGFTFDGFELAERADMLARYPAHATVITKLTRKG